MQGHPIQAKLACEDRDREGVSSTSMERTNSSASDAVKDSELPMVISSSAAVEETRLLAADTLFLPYEAHWARRAIVERVNHAGAEPT